tara:strand:- start:4680 stop:4856 length:177 start_codon:yes stop_codon:yes gene_type:complete
MEINIKGEKAMGDLIFYPVDEKPKKELIYIKIRMHGYEQTIHVPTSIIQSNKIKENIK